MIKQRYFQKSYGRNKTPFYPSAYKSLGTCSSCGLSEGTFLRHTDKLSSSRSVSFPCKKEIPVCSWFPCLSCSNPYVKTHSALFTDTFSTSTALSLILCPSTDPDNRRAAPRAADYPYKSLGNQNTYDTVSGISSPFSPHRKYISLYHVYPFCTAGA